MEAAGIIDDNEKLELLEGEFVPMNAERNKHAVWKMCVNRLWTPRFFDTSAPKLSDLDY